MKYIGDDICVGMITSSDNKQVKLVNKLNNKAKARQEASLFVVEGIKMFLEAPIDRIEHVYMEESFFNSDEGQDVLRRRRMNLDAKASTRKEVSQESDEGAFVDGDGRFDIVKDNVFSTMSDTVTPQGVITLVKIKENNLDDICKSDSKKPLIMILESIQDPGNLGTIFRTGEGAGVTGIIVNKTTVDRFNPKAIRATMGSIYRMPVYESENLSKTIDELKNRDIEVYAAHLRGNEAYTAMNYQGGTAFLIGNEGNGLTDEIADKADKYVLIPMEGQLESLNAGVAAALLMYEAKRQRG